MIRLAATAVIAFLANALGLITAALVLDDMALATLGFIIAVLTFTGVSVMVEPLIRQAALKNAPALLGSTSLLSVLISLLVTALISDSLTIRGAITWVLATVIVWVVALAGRMLLPMVVFKKVLADARSSRT